MGGPGHGDDDAAMRARLKNLSSAIDSRKTSAAPETPPGASAPDGMGSAMNVGARVVTELVSAVVVGAVIGWAIDRWLGSSPVALIVFLVLGTAAGFWNVYRIASRPTRPSGR